MGRLSDIQAPIPSTTIRIQGREDITGFVFHTGPHRSTPRKKVPRRIKGDMVGRRCQGESKVTWWKEGAKENQR
eukprot:scaffold1900_cov183-Ochromonas_danica.AAC.27